MSSSKRNPPANVSKIGALSRVVELVSGADPAAQKENAERHFARARRSRSSKSIAAVRPRTSDRASYLRPIPTRSRVLNAFLHETSHEGLLSPDVHIVEMQMLPLQLIEIVRKYLAPMTAAAGNVEGAL